MDANTYEQLIVLAVAMVFLLVIFFIVWLDRYLEDRRLITLEQLAEERKRQYRILFSPGMV